MTLTLQRAVLGGGWYVPAEHAEVVRAALAVPNPAHRQWMARAARLGPGAGAAPPTHLSPCGPIPDTDTAVGWIWAPRFAPIDVDRPEDRRVCPASLRLHIQPDKGLRDYQVGALGHWLAADRQGVIVAPCGSGKTVLGLAAMAAVHTPALVLVHTKELLEQWVERAREFLEAPDVGIVGDGHRDDGARITIAMLQTLARWDWWDRYRWGQRFGLVILDEAHHAPATLFCQVVSSLPGRYRLGLTATPTRHDGLTALVYWTMGPEVARIAVQDLEAIGAVLPPTIHWVPTGYQPEDTEQAHVRMGALVADPARNAQVLDLVAQLVAEGRQVIALSERVAHCEALAAELQSRGIEAVALVGALSKAARRSLLERLHAGTIRVVTATTIADEALDLPGLDTAVLVTPCGNVGRVQQRVGRIVRPSPGKPAPHVYDLVDDWGPYVSYAWRRFRLYRDLGWTPPAVASVAG